MELARRIQDERRDWAGGVREAYARLHDRFSHVFLCPNARRADAEWRRVADAAIPGADVLEIGASTGASVGEHLARRPRRIVGIDLIEAFVEAARANVPGAEFMAMDAHRTPFPDGSFDVVTGRSILHHLDFNTAIDEIDRVLRPGGTAFFLEPLGDNPAGQLFRALTPRARTADEQPLSRAQIEWADAIFGDQRHRFFGLASTGLGLVTALTSASPQNALLRWADGVDQRIARTSLRYWMRVALLVWRKPKKIDRGERI